MKHISTDDIETATHLGLHPSFPLTNAGDAKYPVGVTQAHLKPPREGASFPTHQVTDRLHIEVINHRGLGFAWSRKG